MAALSNGECRLNGVLFSDDSRYFLTSLISLGYIIQVNEVEKYVIIEGHGGDLPRKEGTINVGSAGTAAYYDKSAELTMTRCEELIEYLK